MAARRGHRGPGGVQRAVHHGTEESRTWTSVAMHRAAAARAAHAARIEAEERALEEDANGSNPLRTHPEPSYAHRPKDVGRARREPGK